MATHSSILAWRIPWKEEPSRLQSMGLHRVRYDWVTNTYIYTYTTIKSRTHITQSILRMPISWIFSKSEDRVFVSKSNSATATVELRPQRKHMDHGVLILPREVQARSTHSACLWRKFWSTIPLQQLNIELVPETRVCESWDFYCGPKDRNNLIPCGVKTGWLRPFKLWHFWMQ